MALSWNEKESEWGLAAVWAAHMGLSGIYGFSKNGIEALACCMCNMANTQSWKRIVLFPNQNTTKVPSLKIRLVFISPLLIQTRQNIANSRFTFLKKVFGIKYSDRILNFPHSDVTESVEPSLIYSPVTVEGHLPFVTVPTCLHGKGAHLSITVIVMDVFFRVLQISQYLISKRNLSTI